MKSRTVRHSFSACRRSPLSKLLQEDREAFRRAQKQDGIDLGNVHPFVVQIDREDDIDLAVDQLALHAAPMLSRTLSGEGLRRDTAFPEKLSHVFRMTYADAKCQPSTLTIIGQFVLE